MIEDLLSLTDVHTQQPMDANGNHGRDVTFSISLSGVPMIYHDNHGMSMEDFQSPEFI